MIEETENEVSTEAPQENSRELGDSLVPDAGPSPVGEDTKLGSGILVMALVGVAVIVYVLLIQSN